MTNHAPWRWIRKPGALCSIAVLLIRIFQCMTPHPGTDFLGFDGELIKLFDLLPPPYPLGWPATLTFIQPELENMLRRAFSQQSNATVHLGNTLLDYEDSGERVDVRFADSLTGETQTISGDILIGCDGANSPVRNQLDVSLLDLGFDEDWLVIDARQLCDTKLRSKSTQYC
jgi:3-(3-hydroxy-phenyl)propionate hydroxylase